jgi:hypothetical protein
MLSNCRIATYVAPEKVTPGCHSTRQIKHGLQEAGPSWSIVAILSERITRKLPPLMYSARCDVSAYPAPGGQM